MDVCVCVCVWLWLCLLSTDETLNVKTYNIHKMQGISAVFQLKSETKIFQNANANVCVCVCV